MDKVPVPAMRPVEEQPGSRENFEALAKLLDGWKCCGAPSICGVACQGDEISAVLAMAHRVISDKLREIMGSIR